MNEIQRALLPPRVGRRLAGRGRLLLLVALAWLGASNRPAVASEALSPWDSLRVAATGGSCQPGAPAGSDLAALLGEGTSNCCAANGGPGCDDPTCSDLICFEIDPFCCTDWDATCAAYANSVCAVCGGSLCPGTESCCTGNPNKPPKCSDPECCGLVCNLDPTCCAIHWDATCRGLAQSLCTTCGGGAGDCCTAHTNPSCNDEGCALTVCQLDPYCCETEWDATCAAAAAQDCSPSACPRTLSVVKSGTGTGSITGTGISCPGDCSQSYGYGTLVTLTAAAAVGSEFSGWSGDCAGSDPQCELTMNAAKSVTGTFVPGPQTMNVTVAGSGTGSVTDGAAGDIDCPGTCSDSYPFDSVVTLTATPSGNATFVGWSGEASSCGTSATCPITMSEQRDVTATFQPPQTLNVTVSGGGSVADGAAGDIDCPGTCSDTYPFGSVVTLSRTVPAGWVFAGWTGEASGCGTNATCNVTMSEQRDVGASFHAVLTVSKSGGGLGSVADGPEGDISCGATCSDSYPLDTVVTLAATATAPSAFSAWSGDCVGGDPCQVTMSAPRAVTATFDPGLAVSLAGDGAGGVSDTTPGGTIACPGDCSSSYATGTEVTLVAAPSGDASFVGWSGSCAGTDPTCTLTLSANRSATATFGAPKTLAVVVVGDGSVADTAPGSTIACPDDCGEIYAVGTTVTLAATPGPDALFSGWSGDCAGTADCDLTMTAARSVTATFVPDPEIFKDGFESGAPCTWSDVVGTDACTPP